ncbi:MAG: DNA-3-methyladenine glycosylase family protein [Chloroflexota bacterium]
MSTTTFTITLPPGVTTAFAFPFQARDPQSNCERGDQTTLRKGIIIDERPVLLELQTAGGRAVTCRVLTGRDGGPAAAALASQAGSMVRRLLGFAPDPLPFEAEVARNPRFAPLRPLVAVRPGLRIPQTPTVWEALAWAIIGQQINLPFAFQLRRELVRLAGRPLGDGFYAFPTPACVAALDYGDLQAVKYSRRKAEYLIDTARLIAGGDLPAERLPEMPFPELEQRLLAVRGIGPWTVNYVAMRGCAFADCVPVGDTGLTTGLMRLFGLDHRPGPDETRSLMAPFAPYRSFVTFHLWQANGGAA